MPRSSRTRQIAALVRTRWRSPSPDGEAAGEDGAKGRGCPGGGGRCTGRRAHRPRQGAGRRAPAAPVACGLGAGRHRHDHRPAGRRPVGAGCGRGAELVAAGTQALVVSPEAGRGPARGDRRRAGQLPGGSQHVAARGDVGGLRRRAGARGARGRRPGAGTGGRRRRADGRLPRRGPCWPRRCARPASVGERVVRLSPLPLPDDDASAGPPRAGAVRRPAAAAAAWTSTSTTPASRADVARICRHAGGLPGIIEWRRHGSTRCRRR